MNRGMDEQLLPDLLQLRGSVVTASDEFFAAKENLTKATAPVFVPDTYDAKGQVYDGWETRRRRGPGGKLPDRSARDWVIVRLGVPGVLRAIVVDTAFFTRNGERRGRGGRQRSELLLRAAQHDLPRPVARDE
jgi:allantoicase